MVSRHAKSPCCRAGIRRFGHRRRQCAACKRTWRIRPKKRGRRRKRLSKALLSKVFLERYSVRLLPHRRFALPVLWHRFRGALRRLVAKKPAHDIPAGLLVLLIDGVWFRFKRQPWVLYQVALKPCDSKIASFLDPILIPGRESAGRWRTVLAAIPPELKARIVALVVDDIRGMRRITKENGWALQLCHVHLIRRMQIQRTMLGHSLRAGPVRMEMYHLVRRILEQPGGPALERDITKLTELAKTPGIPVRIQALMREFLVSISYYRSYLMRPLMHIPFTTNAVESMGGIIRDMLRRSRAGSSPRALQLWATTLTRMRSPITCNGANYQPN